MMEPKKFKRRKPGSWAWSRFQYPPLHCLTWTQNSAIKWLAPTSFCKECWLLQNDSPNKKHAFYKMAWLTKKKSLQNNSVCYKNAPGLTWVKPFHSGNVHRDSFSVLLHFQTNPGDFRSATNNEISWHVSPRTRLSWDFPGFRSIFRRPLRILCVKSHPTGTVSLEILRKQLVCWAQVEIHQKTLKSGN
jgi:hypothetical protein